METINMTTHEELNAAFETANAAILKASAQLEEYNNRMEAALDVILALKGKTRAEVLGGVDASN